MEDNTTRLKEISLQNILNIMKSERKYTPKNKTKKASYPRPPTNPTPPQKKNPTYNISLFTQRNTNTRTLFTSLRKYKKK